MGYSRWKFVVPPWHFPICLFCGTDGLFFFFFFFSPNPPDMEAEADTGLGVNSCCFSLLTAVSRWHLSGTSICINTQLQYLCRSHIVVIWCCSRASCFTNSERESIMIHSHFSSCLVNCENVLCPSILACTGTKDSFQIMLVWFALNLNIDAEAEKKTKRSNK